jgi:soluble lytic murein transglycosylase-like protein
MTPREKKLLLLLGVTAIGAFMTKKWEPPKSAEKYLPLIRENEKKYNMPPNLLARVAYQESHYRDDIINGPYTSSAGAQGIMQIVPRWHPNVNPWNPDEAIPYAAKYLHKLMKRFGNWKDALAAYNWGPTNLSRFKKGELVVMPKETKNYVAEISRDVYGV